MSTPGPSGTLRTPRTAEWDVCVCECVCVCVSVGALWGQGDDMADGRLLKSDISGERVYQTRQVNSPRLPDQTQIMPRHAPMIHDSYST